MKNSKLITTIGVAAFFAGILLSPDVRAFAANTIGSLDIIDGSIKAVDVSNSAITKDKIAAGAVSNQKIANEAVTNGKIAPNAVTSTRIMDDTITAADLKADSVGASELQGVSKLIFATCDIEPEALYIYSGPSDFIAHIKCDVPGASVGDSVIASIERAPKLCDTCTVAVSSATVFEEGVVKILVFNHNFDYADTLDYVYTADEDGYFASVYNADSGSERIWSIKFNVIVFAN